MLQGGSLITAALPSKEEHALRNGVEDVFEIRVLEQFYKLRMEFFHIEPSISVAPLGHGRNTDICLHANCESEPLRQIEDPPGMQQKQKDME